MAVTLIGGIAVPGSVALAQEDGDSTDANVQVGLGITITGLTESFTLSGAPGATVESVSAVDFNVETNNVAGYVVTVVSETATLVPTEVGNTDSIPIASLTVRESGTTTYSPLSATTPVVVHSQDGRSADGGDDLSNDYQLRIPVVNADTYSATLDYVATTL